MIVGGRITVNAVLLAHAPFSVTTVIGPLVAPAGTAVRICVALSTVKAAAVPLKRTSLTPLKFCPLIVTVAPATPCSGVKEVITGGSKAMTKLLADCAEPAMLVTSIGPSVAPAGTVTRTCESESTWKAAGAPLMRTALALVKELPCTVTSVPMPPRAGVKPDTVGAPTPMPPT